ncbi:MAG: hypothetical protein ABSE90_10970 [Verrucomicrobiota bacterium]
MLMIVLANHSGPAFWTLALPARFAPHRSKPGVASGALAKIIGCGSGRGGIQTPHGGFVTTWANDFFIGTDKEHGAPFAPVPTIVGLVIASFN